ncbi:MAG TPA: sigma-70 family RNA polymerase sigma factor [Puia sp.]|nr:sigma-70 family RNA polymerase sigma factor [Puia sp.]
MPITRDEFEGIFLKYYESLYGYAFSILNSELNAEEIVSDVFYRLWMKKDAVRIDASITGYLYKSTYNASMDHIRHSRKDEELKKEVLHQSMKSGHGADTAVGLNTREFEKNLRQALQHLPDALEKSGQNDEAISMYKRSIMLDLRNSEPIAKLKKLTQRS